MRTYALDTETFYDKECSVATMGVYHYCRHKDFECYLVTVAGDDGTEYCGQPEDLDWSLFSGPGTTWISHNLSFDGHVVDWMREVGQIPAYAKPEAWYCTADMCAWFGLPRSLAGAADQLLGIKPDKSVRDKMKGRRFGELNAADNLELLHYAIEDARICLKLWQTLEPGHALSEGKPYPLIEKQLSAYTAEMGWRGLPMDLDGLDQGISHVGDLIWQAEQNIPWAENFPTLSPKALAEECRKVGIEPPKSLAKDSEECAIWENTYGDQYPWVDAMRTYRRCNALKKKMQTMRSRIKADGRMAFNLKFCGALTRRWSGDSGVNLQNLPRTEMFGVDLRQLIKAPPGRTFAIADLSQIEPRCLSLLAGDTTTLELLRTGMGPYEVHARATMGWTGGKLKSENQAMYSLAKARCLALGYGAGFEKFIMMAGNYVGPDDFDIIFRSPVTPHMESEFKGYLRALKDQSQWDRFIKLDAATQVVWINSWHQVVDYRRSNPLVVALWKKFDEGFRRSVGRDFTLELPSGNLLRYRKLTSICGMTALLMRGGRYIRSRVYGGLGVENACQAMARDVFADMWARLLDQGLRVVMSVHDELVVECDEADADRVLALMIHEMSIAPDWVPELPLGAEGSITPTYTK